MNPVKWFCGCLNSQTNCLMQVHPRDVGAHVHNVRGGLRCFSNPEWVHQYSTLAVFVFLKATNDAGEWINSTDSKLGHLLCCCRIGCAPASATWAAEQGSCHKSVTVWWQRQAHGCARYYQVDGCTRRRMKSSPEDMQLRGNRKLPRTCDASETRSTLITKANFIPHGSSSVLTAGH